MRDEWAFWFLYDSTISALLRKHCTRQTILNISELKGKWKNRNLREVGGSYWLHACVNKKLNSAAQTTEGLFFCCTLKSKCGKDHGQFPWCHYNTHSEETVKQLRWCWCAQYGAHNANGWRLCLSANHQPSHSCISWSVLHTWAFADKPEKDKVELYLFVYLYFIFLHDYCPNISVEGYTVFCLCSLHEACRSDLNKA